jgi:hypothetical protein
MTSKRWTRPKPDPKPAPGHAVWIDDEGLSHATLGDFVALRLGFCGCGDPDAALDLVLRVLSLVDARSSRRIDGGEPMDRVAARAALDEILKPETTPEGLYWSFWYMLDDKGLLEHGSMITGAWLTEDGEEVLRMLREWNEKERRRG